MLFTGFIPLYVILNVLNYRQQRAQLQKEKGKNKMLMQRLKEGDNTNTSQDIIWAQGPPNSHGQSNISHFRFYWKCNFPINLHDCWLVGRSGCHNFLLMQRRNYRRTCTKNYSRKENALTRSEYCYLVAIIFIMP